jgi:Fe-S oxidoreductase
MSPVNLYAAQPASPLRDTCIECGKCDSCDDACPNYQEREVAPNDREIRTGAHLLQMAKSLGWPDDGEGALEFMLRRAREVAFEDCAALSATPALDLETIETLLALLNPLHGDLDKQTYDEKVSLCFDASRDHEYAVTVTAQHERDLNQAVYILESRLRNV